MPDSERRADHDRLCTLAMVDQLATTLDACLGWDDLATLARHPLARIGVHTRSHPLLARLDSAASRDEMILAKVEIERRLGMPATSIAYPVGDAAAAGPREFAMAADFGLRLGVTTRPGLLFADHLAHPMALPRLSVNGLHQNLDHMEVLLSGLPFAMLNRGRRLNVG
jgi:peptidoglycan/xylan/chitin deacetylase (PgdA/CDA1 family)